MKRSLLISLALLFCLNTLLAQNKPREIKERSVEASCAQCQFKVKEPRGCDLSIRMDGKIYFVDGTHLDAYGDAHEEDGFCMAIRQATVSGTITGNRIKVSRLTLKPLVKKD